MVNDEAEETGVDQLPTEKDIEKFKYLSTSLTSLYEEISKVSSKKHDSLVSSYKIKLINKTLEGIKELIRDDPAIVDLDLLSDSDIPQFSDVAMLLGQFASAVDRFQSKFYRHDTPYTGRWVTQENPPDEYDDEVEEEFP